MEEQSEFVKEKIANLGADTIMGAALNKDKLESIDKLQKAIEEHEEAEAVEEEVTTPKSAITGDQLEILKQAGYFRKTRPIVRDNKKIGRNDPCPCGALDEYGYPKKYKNCCMNTGKYETTHYE